MAASTTAPDGTHAAHLHDRHDGNDGSDGCAGGHDAAHVHILSALQEEALCWTAGCFVVVAIVFAIWTLRTAPALQRKTQRKISRKSGRKKRRAGRSAPRLQGKRR